MSTLRPLLRRLAYRTGALGLARTRLRSALTVIMLHRVIDPTDPDFAAADPTYTLSLPTFIRFLTFLRDHYHIVSLADVLAARETGKRLPQHALLLSFDDGWADNLRYAAPVLHSMQFPAVVFAVAEAVQSSADVWWQEQVFAAGRNGSLGSWITQCPIEGEDPIDASGGPELQAFAAVTRLCLMDAAARDRSLRGLAAPPHSGRMMLTPEELSELPQFGIDVGLHGYTHIPLTASPDVLDELNRAKAAVVAMTGETAAAHVLGCPHGRYDSRVVEVARAAGIRLIFTSDPWLNVARGGLLDGDGVLGRINVSAWHIEDHRGHFDPSAAARWLWDREIH